jgi:hypothetical protein
MCGRSLVVMLSTPANLTTMMTLAGLRRLSNATTRRGKGEKPAAGLRRAKSC